MPNDLTTAKPGHTEDLAVTEYDAERRIRLAAKDVSDTGTVLPTNDEVPEVGLSQKGDGEDAVVKRETEI
ncbi:hypothetical protein [Methylobacterium sp. J-076]|uniref:hypothetical protein n=1 Tax=Methylobacterium sp. J-076 TaxID=2836655 RepID=UPI001FB95D28|nr:hypothetical protein [Methylobacterium sp. J-076]MCJ2012049.1 hypothetical protein [Methylobacterium sp. J-076]